MSNQSQNLVLAARGFDRYGGRNPLSNDPEEQVDEPIQKFQQAMTLPELSVANNAFRAWGHGARVANTKGFFCASPPQSHPVKNSDYLRLFVDAYSDGGYGVLNMPMSGELYFNDTGDLPSQGHVILRLVGPSAAGTNNLVSPRNIGIADFSSVIYLLAVRGSLNKTGGSAFIGSNIITMSNTTGVEVGNTITSSGTSLGATAKVVSISGDGVSILMNVDAPATESGLTFTFGAAIESSGLFDTAGAIYHNTSTGKVRHYTGSAWENL